MKLSWSLNMQKSAISNLKEPWPQMNKVNPYSIIHHSDKNTRWFYVSAKCHMKITRSCATWAIAKDNNVIVGPKVFNPNRPKKVRILTMRNKGAKVEHGGSHLIPGQ